MINERNKDTQTVGSERRPLNMVRGYEGHGKYRGISKTMECLLSVIQQHPRHLHPSHQFAMVELRQPTQELLSPPSRVSVSQLC